MGLLDLGKIMCDLGWSTQNLFPSSLPCYSKPSPEEHGLHNNASDVRFNSHSLGEI